LGIRFFGVSPGFGLLELGNYPLTVGIEYLFGCVDQRFGDGPRHHLTPPKDIDMRVPDQIRKSVAFIGVYGDLPEPEWRATAYIIAVPDAMRIFRREDERFISTSVYPFTFIATARHVAEKLEGKKFALRVNTCDGGVRIIAGEPNTRWWYHPTEKQYVDAALAMFLPGDFGNLDIQTIQIGLFADNERIQASHIGAGDEVFVAGLFTKIANTTQNIPIVRIGNLAMMPDEKIPFKDGKMIEAYLVETRSIGGLSGSPVFVRETVTIQELRSGIRFNSPYHVPPDDLLVSMSGLGKIWFLGSMIGHWDTPTESLHIAIPEAVNMGISPMVPAQKIKEILLQKELLDMVKQVNEEIASKKHAGAVYDFADEKKPLTREDFEDALKKATRKVSDRK
jgi:hypothetical protein